MADNPSSAAQPLGTVGPARIVAAVKPLAFHGLEESATAGASQILLAVHQIAAKYSLHDDMLDGILVELGLE